MGKVKPVSPAALIAGIFFSDEVLANKALDKMIAEYGPVFLKSETFDFTMTDYYTEEMGSNLRKCFYCFKKPIECMQLSDIKLFTNDIEMEAALKTGDTIARRVNIDPGYVTLSKLILATTKDYSHRIYIGKNIYAEVTLHFLRGTFAPFIHTYPDYQTPLSIEFFNNVREYVKTMRSQWNRENE
ncbi:MAG: DUF4416 family protein [Candidatus Latescibacteria bacterium]|nr:DUF4416 family protein [Candidatus Latescibacterota bacterium]